MLNHHAIVLVITTLFMLIFPLSAFPDTINVPGDYPTIQGAIDAAVAGDVVLVGPGTYVENLDFLGKAITVKSSDGPEDTVIDGSGCGSVVKFVNDEGLDSGLKEFTLTNGSGTLNYQGYSGGGIYCWSSSPSVTDNIIIHNNVYASGGGIYCESYSSPLIANNTISANSAWTGAGIFSDMKSSPTIIGNQICGNQAPDHCGGGVYGSRNSILLIINNIIAGNTANNGGGIFCVNSSLDLINNTIIGNTAYEDGGGVSCYTQLATITNTIIWNNTDPYSGEIFLTGALSIAYSNIKGGKNGVYVSSGNLDWGPGMINAEPLFVDSPGADYHLLIGSPCIDQGDSSVSTLPPFDFEDDPRCAYGDVDIGADEFYPHFYYTGNPTPGGYVEVKIIGLPWSFPVGIFIGSGVIDPPLPTAYGYWYLQSPTILIDMMCPIPMSSLVVLTAQIPPGSSFELYMQAFIGGVLSNLSVMEVR